MMGFITSMFAEPTPQEKEAKFEAWLDKRFGTEDVTMSDAEAERIIRIADAWANHAERKAHDPRYARRFPS